MFLRSVFEVDVSNTFSEEEESLCVREVLVPQLSPSSSRIRIDMSSTNLEKVVGPFNI